MKLVEQRDIITVEPMDEAHALALFEKKLGMQGDGDDIAELDRRSKAFEAQDSAASNDEVVRWLQTWGTPAFRAWRDR